MKTLTLPIMLALAFLGSHCFAQQQQQQQQYLSKMQLRDLDRMVVQLLDESRELHAEFHEHLQGVPHGEKLEAEATAMETIAGTLHNFVLNADGSAATLVRIRSVANQFIQHSYRISRTIDLAAAWTRSNDQRRGITHMKSAAQEVIRTAMQIDAMMPVDSIVIDGQAEILEDAVKELHAEYHEHLEGYEVSAHLDRDLEELELLVEHMHQLVHGRAWSQIDLRHLSGDIREVQENTSHIESLFVRQSQIGVRTRDYVGIEHSRDAITDVLSAAYLMEHMIARTQPRAHSFGHSGENQYGQNQRRRPRRDR